MAEVNTAYLGSMNKSAYRIGDGNDIQTRNQNSSSNSRLKALCGVGSRDDFLEILQDDSLCLKEISHAVTNYFCLVYHTLLQTLLPCTSELKPRAVIHYFLYPASFLLLSFTVIKELTKAEKSIAFSLHFHLHC